MPFFFLFVAENPCNSHPCGSLGACDLDGVQYYCNCTSTAIYNGITCITDPCHSNPCDKYSTCRHNEDFEPECYCTEGITCIVDECHVEELEHSNCITLATCEESSLDLSTGWKHHDCKCRYEVINGTNVTNVCPDGGCDERTCDENVNCNYIDMPGGIRYNCSCAPGYTFNTVGKCEKDQKPYLWMIVVVAVVLVVVALIVGFRYIIKSKPQETCGKKIPYSDDISTSPPEPNLNNHPHDESPEDPRPYERVPDAHAWESAECASNQPDKRILIISTEETEEHRNVVYKFAIFLKTHAGLLPIVPSQHINEIHKLSLETWLSEENRQAFKVLFICSEGMQRRWEQERKAVPNLDSRSPGENAFGDLFIQMKHITSTERLQSGMLHKFVVAYFGDYFSKRMVNDIELLRGMPRFNLMTEIEQLCFLLNGIEQYTPTSNRRMPNVSKYESVPEGQALMGAIGMMTERCGASYYGRAISSNPDTPTSEGSGVSNHFELNSQDGGFDFQLIPENDKQAMTSASDFFSPFGSDDRSSSSRSSSVLHQVDVHRESSDDGDFPQAVSETLNEPHSLGNLDSGLSSLPMSRLSSQEDAHVTSLDDFVVHVPTKHEDNSLDSGLHSQPQSCTSGAQGISLA
ncbi:uncharacterized protein LOC129257594 isoform X1 [Lytechinus pictus]|uniref:uncharacterized protein LOC129257594 isoform X1 n=1 Tax=Lytechinus pictus TaxID=7653 RepID=UPI0030BA2529